MSNYTGGVNTVCPFYDRETRFSVSCEGIKDGSVLTMRYPSAESRKEWQECYCFSFNYKSCPIAMLASKKYETSKL